MAAGSRRVVWSASAEAALDEILGHIAKTSTDGMARVLVRALDTAQSLDRFAERGRVVEEIGDPTLRELLVYAKTGEPMTTKAWWYIALLVAFGAGEGSRWIAAMLGVTNHFVSDGVMLGVFVGAFVLIRRVFGIASPHNPYPGSDASTSLKR